MIHIDNITVRFKEKVIFNQISFQANKGEIIGVVAPNGTGKTTLFNVLMNFISPKEGQIIINELQHPKDTIQIRKYMTILPNQADLFDELTGYEHLKMYSKVWNNKSKVDEIVDRLEMGIYVKKKVRTYSLGMRQRLCFAMILAANTQIMLLDEVMNGLDPHNVAVISVILKELKEEGKCILIASHLLNNLDLYANRTIFLHDGKIVHELNLENRLDQYFIIHTNERMLADIFKLESVRKENCVFAQSMIAIPLANQTEEILNEIFSLGVSEVKIGSLGTPEYYDVIYRKSKEVQDE